MGTAGMGGTSQVSALSSVRRGDLRRQSQIIADESSSVTSSGGAAKTSGTVLRFCVTLNGDSEIKYKKTLKKKSTPLFYFRYPNNVLSSKQ